MSARVWSTVLAGLACAALTSATLGAPPEQTSQPRTQSEQHRVARHAASQSNAMKEMVTLEIRGACTAEDARILNEALSSHHVMGTVQPSQEKPYRVNTSIAQTADLGACGQAVINANTPDKAKDPPSLDLVMFGKFDKVSAKKATEALAKIKGVDARHSSVDESKGELSIRITGGEKVTPDQIHRALQGAEVSAHFTRGKTARTS